MEAGFQVAYGKTLWVLYVCLVPPEVDPGNGESEEISGIPKNDLDCHGGRRVTRRQPDLAIVCIQVRVHVTPSCVSCRPRSQSVSRQRRHECPKCPIDSPVSPAAAVNLWPLHFTRGQSMRYERLYPLNWPHPVPPLSRALAVLR